QQRHASGPCEVETDWRPCLVAPERICPPSDRPRPPSKKPQEQRRVSAISDVLRSIDANQTPIEKQDRDQKINYKRFKIFIATVKSGPQMDTVKDADLVSGHLHAKRVPVMKKDVLPPDTATSSPLLNRLDRQKKDR